MKRGFTSALSLGALLFVATHSVYAEEPAPAAPDPGTDASSESAEPSRGVGLGLAPIAPPTPPALGGRAASFGANKDPSEAAFRLGGTIFGSETVGIGTRGQATEPGQTSTVLHVPARYQGRVPLYVGVNAGLYVTYGTPVVAATTTFYAHSSGKEWEGYYNPALGPSFSQAYLTVTPPPLGKLRLHVQVGAFSEVFGSPGQWGWGTFGPLLAIRGYGESMSAEYDATSDTRLFFEHGLGGIPSVPESFVRGTYTTWNETGVSTVFQHAHVGINYQNKYIARLHFASVYGTDEHQYLNPTRHDGRMNIYIAEAHWFTDAFGQIGLSGGLWDFSHATPIQDGVWWGLNYTQGAQDMTRNYLGLNSNGTGRVAGLSAEYDLSLAHLLWYPQPFDGNGPDVRMIFAAVADRTLQSEDPQFKHATGYLFGEELDYRMRSWFSVTLRSYGESRTLDQGQWRVMSVSPGIAFRSDWQSLDHIELIYSRLFYSGAVDNNPAAPLDRSVLTLAAGMDF
ncbi:MAG TPA: hypothetical protein VK745_26415 [Polyangiaceae bacterium]|jgi:hypothetical protein|nr:hypothetical protein [Polyangiaceae bacterium]